MTTTHRMHIVGPTTGTTFAVQRATFNSSPQLSGHIECPDMIDPPSESIFAFYPFKLMIKLTLAESKMPEFVVIGDIEQYDQALT